MHRTLLGATPGKLPFGAAAKWLGMVVATGVMFASASPSQAQLLHKKKKVNKSTAADNTAEPDKVLYERAVNDIKHGRHEVGRLALQTLINTYPDSEYLAKAKLGIADSYYKEGSTANMTLAIQGYKDFIVFFPFLSEASYAQLQVANAHYQQMAKPDRDRTEARAAEDEYQTFLQKYPHDPLAPKAEQRLRDVQEVIAEADYRIGYFYYVKGDRRAAAARLISVTRRYPLYSKSDKALWMLGDIFEKSEHKEVASIYYGMIVRNYPLSGMVPEAKNKLVAFKVPVPQPDPKAVAWMTAEQNAPREKPPIYKRPLAMVQNGPGDEKRISARTGLPNLQPEADNTSATDVLSGGNTSSLGRGGPAGNTAVVETVTPGTGRPSEGTAGGSEGSSPAEGNGPTAGSDATPSAAPAEAPAQLGAAPATPAGSGNAPESTSTPANGKSDAPPEAPQAADDAKTDNSQAASSSDDSKNQKESSSKKKKHKLVPW